MLLQATKAGEAGDEEFIRLAAEDAELARAKERLTLRHRNSSRWARRALKRGMDVMDEGTKAAVAEQLRLGEELRQKVHWLQVTVLLFWLQSACLSIFDNVKAKCISTAAAQQLWLSGEL